MFSHLTYDDLSLNVYVQAECDEYFSIKHRGHMRGVGKVTQYVNFLELLRTIITMNRKLS